MLRAVVSTLLMLQQLALAAAVPALVPMGVPAVVPAVVPAGVPAVVPEVVPEVFPASGHVRAVSLLVVPTMAPMDVALEVSPLVVLALLPAAPSLTFEKTSSLA